VMPTTELYHNPGLYTTLSFESENIRDGGQLPDHWQLSRA
jgi:hypothetical protein